MVQQTTLRRSLLALSIGMALASFAQAQASAKGLREAEARLAADLGSSPEVAMHAATGTARFVRIAPGVQANALSRGARPSTDAAKHSAATQFLSNYGGVFGISSAGTELAAGRLAKDRQGGTHITHRQVYQGIPVFGGELKTHFDAAGNLTVANGTFVPGIDLNPKPSRTAEQASATALARVLSDLGRSVKLSTGTPTLMVYREGLAKGVPGANHLVWQVEVGNRSDVREFVYVDAHSGKIVDKINGIHDAKNRRAFDAVNQPHPGPNYPNNPFWVEGQPFPTGNTEADNMIQASSEIYDLFKNAFGRDSFDGNGARMDSIFNRGGTAASPCPNASWNGIYISFCPGTTTDDVTAHEWGHAYTEYTHGLIYQWQPGALNEAYSDIWGETLDRINGRGGDTPDNQRSDGACSVYTPNLPSVTVSAPAALAGVKRAGTAAFGPQSFSVAGQVVQVNDGVGTGNDACETPFANAAEVAGKIAFVDRGTCGFAVKVKNAQLNGAIGVIVGNNQGGNTVAGMAGADASITIPSLAVSQNDGTAFKAQFAAAATVTATVVRGGYGTDSSVRWLMGEDSSAFGGAIRDMYNPACYGNAGKVSDVRYTCSTGDAAGDNGGVHSNSGVPNHAYALLVDGGNYNGQSIAAIGLTKAAHIYYRAQTFYQGPASDFAAHADAIEQSCRDLVGVNLNHLKTGAPSGEIITASDCTQVEKAALAVELRTPPSQCNYQTVLAKSPPPLCATGTPTALASDNFDGGRRGGLKWVVSNVGSKPEFLPRNWSVVTSLPGKRAGYAMFAADADIGTCAPGSDQSGLQRLESPEITIPAGGSALRMTFDHWVGTEAGYDGGNLKISVNGGAWQLVKAADFVYNAYNTTLATVAQDNTNPLAGQPAFSGGDAGTVSGGSWGRSIVNLAPYAKANDKVKLRFELGNDGCGGTFGWYLDDFSVYQCTP